MKINKLRFLILSISGVFLLAGCSSEPKNKLNLENKQHDLVSRLLRDNKDVKSFYKSYFMELGATEEHATESSTYVEGAQDKGLTELYTAAQKSNSSSDAGGKEQANEYVTKLHGSTLVQLQKTPRFKAEILINLASSETLKKYESYCYANGKRNIRSVFAKLRMFEVLSPRKDSSFWKRTFLRKSPFSPEREQQYERLRNKIMNNLSLLGRVLKGTDSSKVNINKLEGVYSENISRQINYHLDTSDNETVDSLYKEFLEVIGRGEHNIYKSLEKRHKRFLIKSLGVNSVYGMTLVVLAIALV